MAPRPLKKEWLGLRGTEAWQFGRALLARRGPCRGTQGHQQLWDTAMLWRADPVIGTIPSIAKKFENFEAAFDAYHEGKSMGKKKDAWVSEMVVVLDKSCESS